VVCNRALRRELLAACKRERLTLRLAEPALSTDNAAMICILAERKLERRVTASSLDADIQPGWEMSGSPKAEGRGPKSETK